MHLYRYDIHTHTSEVSKCAAISPEELVRFYKNMGFAGICITDHFFNGNTTVPGDLPWNVRVELFCRGFEKARAEGEKMDFDVFFGWEYSYRGTDFLTFGLDKEWLLNHPDLLSLNVNDYCDLVHSEGGFIVQAHPFREADYISMIRLLPRKVDAVEIINGGNNDFENRCADKYADMYNLIKVAGSDTHSDKVKKLAGIQLNRRLKDINDMISAIKNGETRTFSITL
ncbi:putative PHP domain protein [Thermoclostridium stercorarium subsp. stercorarium DSM 8532]|uniref:Histidinol phosphatase n=3 Tax=Thermoclostridium stercorarium TaxID=1510 RepID=A0A1B1YHR4_THEST|nr:PHP domain-containing protein [Thermoclostridium stercorarium]AGC67240.1 putative PHP domain protein [Thermoclostridium stercorarium subsp. stercorarium DSM 8532]AGI38311.1 phosphoesterase [Thermoclostridium stercorarium subsp. stercorarium DSM 8532]ANW97747.1 histidinol phosphatase [Thermoclostridium stercorarium subsp. thermolacticum DSM 2910]ANX00272.1 histidinol phosphatase [Thermoclostridium stercorarium subsp. leptospartum DSM 9219]